MQNGATVVAAMRALNGEYAYGSECNAWQDFVEDCHRETGKHPADVEAEEIDVSDAFGEYWLAVANGQSPDYVKGSRAYIGGI